MSICVLLLGPGVNKAVLLQLQQAKEKNRQGLEMKNSMREFYDNLSYEDNEIKQDLGLNTTHGPTDTSRPSQVTENHKEERIDNF